MKHVIFLGAGASYTSGYPLAEKLRKEWLVSVDVLRTKLVERMEQTLGIPERNEAIRQFDQWIEPAENALKLFRQGCFGTIDEFCYLVRDTRRDEVKALKEVLRFVFGLHTPEQDFVKSDYYAFIQRLFDPRDLSRLKDEITVLTFNYDPYLEWLLRRAYQTRIDAVNQLNQRGLVLDAATDAAITSGFSGGTAGLKALRTGAGFCLLKLHGTAAWPNEPRNEIQRRGNPHCCHSDFFTADFARKVTSLTDHTPPPILFPWEVFDSGGGLSPADSFALRDEIVDCGGSVFRNGGRGAEDPNLHEIFGAIWSRARSDVQAADKISFVGISMHDYLHVGFTHLFRGRAGNVAVSITDRENAQKPTDNVTPRTPSSRLLEMRTQICPGLQFPEFNVRKDFEEFILKDL